MIYADSHCHTSFSGDSQTDPVRQIRRAMELGMSHLTITDHYDMDYPPCDIDFTFSVPDYLQAISGLRDQFAGQLDVGIGMELGLQPYLTEELRAFTENMPYDFIIGSTHVAGRLDPYDFETFRDGRSGEDALRFYFEEELRNLSAFDCYDVAGHLDYAIRYGPDKFKTDIWPICGDILEEILRVLIDKGKGLECNTAAKRAGLSFFHPAPSIWKRYRELGGEILTLGSDAHVPEDLGSLFPEAGEFLKSLGFRYYAVYRGHKPIFFPL